MEPLRLLHFADVHLGVEAGGRTNPSTGLNQRVHDVCDRLDEVCAAAERDNVHAVLFAGDAFKHQHPTPTLQSLFAARMRRLARSGTAVFLLVGNHDLPKMAGLAHPFSIYSALEVDGVVVGERAHLYELPLPEGSPVPSLQVGALPHFSRQQVLARLGDHEGDVDALIAQRISDTMRDLAARVDPARPAVFVGHCHVNQAEVGEAQALFGVSDVELSVSTLVAGTAFAYYALGHVHRRQVLHDSPPVAYCGSLERVDFGEGDRIEVSATAGMRHRHAEPKGFYRIDLVCEDGRWCAEGQPEFRTVAARRFVSVRLPDLDSEDPTADLGSRMDAVRDGGVELSGAFVRLIAMIEGAHGARLTAAAARALIPEAYDVRVVVETRAGPDVRDPRFARRMTETEALERFLDTRTDWTDDRTELARIGRELIAEVLGQA